MMHRLTHFAFSLLSLAVGLASLASAQPFVHPGGIPIGTFAIAAELMRSYPVCHDSLTRHNGRCDSAFWANWDTCNMRAIMAIGVFCDDRAKFDEAVEYFKNGLGTGFIGNAAPQRVLPLRSQSQPCPIMLS